MSKLILVVVLLSFSAVAALRGPFPSERELRPFKTDGCTMAPEGTPQHPNLFRPCCILHDLRFWGGGTEAERDHADLKLRACIRAKAGATWAAIFYNAVRAGRLSPWTIESKRWGNAWYEYDGYRQLSADEVLRLRAAVPLLGLPDEMKQEYLSELEARPAH